MVEAIVREAAGSPFFLEQLTRHAATSRSGVSAGLSLVEMMEERLQQLPRGGVELLHVLAAAGRPVAAAVAAEAAGVAGDERRLLAALKTACLVRGGAPEQAEREIAAAAAAAGAEGAFHLLHWGVLGARAQVRLYRGEGREALAGLDAEWPRLEASLLLRIGAARVEATHLRARGLLAAAREEDGRRRRRCRRRAEAVARRLRRERLAHARPFADLVSAGAAALAGRRDAARRALAGAAAGFEACDMRLYALAARRRLAELAGDDGERVLADGVMTALGVASPERMTRMLAPGF